jgi:hypothetical protein
VHEADHLSKQRKEKEMTMQPAGFREAIEAARGLKSEHGENYEYDRALVELIRDLFNPGLDSDDSREIVAVAIGVVQ